MLWGLNFHVFLKTKMLKNKIKTFLAFKLSDSVSVMLINVKMPKIVGILTFIRMTNSMLSSVEQKILNHLKI